MSLQTVDEVLQLFADDKVSPSSLIIKKYEDGFWYRDGFNINSFLKKSHRMQSKRMRFEQFLQMFRAPQKQAVVWQLSAGDRLDVARFANDTLLVWAQKYFYKISISEKSSRRIEKAENNYNLIKYSKIGSFLAPLEFSKRANYCLQKSEAGAYVELSPRGISRMDDFFCQYFSAAKSGERDGLISGFEHGDLQINNLLEFSGNQIKIIDLDQYKENGYPFVDILSAALHYVGFYVFNNYFTAIDLLLNDPSEMANCLEKNGFLKMATCWRKNFSSKYYKPFFTNKMVWLKANKHESDFGTKLSSAAEKFI